MSRLFLQKIPTFLIFFANHILVGRHIDGNAMNGAIFCAFTAAYTLFRVNGSQIIGYRYGAVFAHLCALTATNATNLAGRARYRTLIVAGATHHAVYVTVVHSDKSFGTSRYALGATATNRGIYACQTVFHRNGFVLACRLTITVA